MFDRFKQNFREEVKAAVAKYRATPFLLDDESITDVLEETIEDIEAGLE